MTESFNRESHEQEAIEIIQGITSSGKQFVKDVSFNLWTKKVPDNDDDITILGNCFLYRSAGGVLVGPPGAGKSTLILQLCISWSLGMPCLGICPAKKLRILYFQGEGIDRQTVRRKNSILDGLGIPQSRILQEKPYFRVVWRPDLWSTTFLMVLQKFLETDSVDLIIIDPLFSYFYESASSQELITRFLRGQIDPLLFRFNTSCLFIHHISKSAARDNTVDPLFHAFGSVEIPNWSRAAMTLMDTGVPSIFKLNARKNGVALGWTDKNGDIVTSKLLKHNPTPGQPNSVLWTEVSENETVLPPTEIPKTFTFGERQYRGRIAQALHILARAEENRLPFQSVCEQLGILGIKDQQAFRIEMDNFIQRGWRSAGIPHPWAGWGELEDIWINFGVQ